MSRSNIGRLSISFVDSCPHTGLPVLENWELGFSSIRWMSLLLRIQIARPIIFVGKIVGGGRGDTHTHFLVHDFFRFHHFRDTISWECIVEDDCVRSCLIEIQSFSFSKLYIDLIHRILVHFPLLLVRCTTWFGQIKLFWILVILMHGIHGCKEYRLSVLARILSSRYHS